MNTFLKTKLAVLLTVFGIVVLITFYTAITVNQAKAEGSGTWGTATNRRSMLWVPSSRTLSGQGGEGWFTSGYRYRGFMMLPSSANNTVFPNYDTNYNPQHRVFVYVRNGETVFWGFRLTAIRRRDNSFSNNVRIRWFYDSNDTGFFPSARTAGQGRTMIQGMQFNAVSAGGANGRPNNGAAAANGPSQITGTGYTAFSFVNNTGEDRAFWIEITDESDEPIWYGANIDFWDVTVASGTPGNYTRINGRLYCKFWSIANSRSDKAATANSPTFSIGENFRFHTDFGFFVPVDNTFTPDPNDYFVKRITFPQASGGWTNFFANEDGPRNNLSFDENRRSITNDPVTNQPPPPNIQYPLFLNDPDPSIWQTTEPPTVGLDVVYDEKEAPLTGGEAFIDIDVSLPAVVDILIDLNGNGIYDEGVDLLISRNFTEPGVYQIYWNGEDSSGNEIESGAEVDFYVAVIFFPVHFPIYDLEYSNGIFVRNIRPGNLNEPNDIYWDDSLIPRTGPGITGSPQSIPVNLTGVPSPDHRWTATGDNGFGNNVTINTWAASYYTEVKESSSFSFYRIYGNVFNDVNGLADNLISGPSSGLTNLRVVLINEANRVVRSSPVQADGTFTLLRVPNGTLSIMLTTRSSVLGAAPPEQRIPAAWESVGENLGPGEGSDGIVDGILTGVVVNNATLFHANFGIRLINADLTVLKIVNETFPRIGTPVEFTIIAGNNGVSGYSNAREVEVQENMPDGYEYISHTVSRGSFDPTTGIWTLGDMNYGESATLSITAMVVDHTDYENTVSITTPTFEEDLTNNFAAASTIPFVIVSLEWLSFEGWAKNNRTIELKWITSEENEKHLFNVWRSPNGRDWRKIASVPNEIDAGNKGRYTIIDQNPMLGINFYRLEYQEPTGQADFSEVIRVDLFKEQAFTVFPNPHKESFQIQALNLENYQLELFDAMGKTLQVPMTAIDSHTIQVKTQHLPQGVYFIRVFNQEQSLIKKLLKD